MEFVDSNVWLYALVRGSDPIKRKSAVSVVSNPMRVISSQVINEVCVNLIRKAGFDDDNIARLVRAFYKRCVVIAVDESVMLSACKLRSSYSLSYWDSLIVAAALRAGCSKLYSEDMCTGQIIEGTLTIVNPF